MTEIYVFLVVTVSNFLQATTGFGYAIVTTPLLAMVLPPKESVMLTMTTGLIARMSMLKVISGSGSFADIKPLLMTSVIGAVVGSYVLTTINSYWLKLFIAVVLLVTGWAMWKERRVEITNQKSAERAVGILAGFLGSTTSINGPPIIMYYLNAGLDKQKDIFRANLTRYFLLMNFITLFLAFWFGTLEIGNIWKLTVLAIPGLWLGLYLGEKFFQRIDAQAFKRMTIIMVIASAIMIITHTLGV